MTRDYILTLIYWFWTQPATYRGGGGRKGITKGMRKTKGERKKKGERKIQGESKTKGEVKTKKNISIERERERYRKNTSYS